jgi:hypothetical protein
VKRPHGIDLMIFAAIALFALAVAIYLAWEAWRMLRIELPS